MIARQAGARDVVALVKNVSIAPRRFPVATIPPVSIWSQHRLDSSVDDVCDLVNHARSQKRNAPAMQYVCDAQIKGSSARTSILLLPRSRLVLMLSLTYLGGSQFKLCHQSFEFES